MLAQEHELGDFGFGVYDWQQKPAVQRAKALAPLGNLQTVTVRLYGEAMAPEAVGRTEVPREREGQRHPPVGT